MLEIGLLLIWYRYGQRLGGVVPAKSKRMLATIALLGPTAFGIYLKVHNSATNQVLPDSTYWTLIVAAIAFPMGIVMLLVAWCVTLLPATPSHAHIFSGTGTILVGRITCLQLVQRESNNTLLKWVAGQKEKQLKAT